MGELTFLKIQLGKLRNSNYDISCHGPQSNIVYWGSLGEKGRLWNGRDGKLSQTTWHTGNGLSLSTNLQLTVLAGILPIDIPCIKAQCSKYLLSRMSWLRLLTSRLWSRASINEGLNEDFSYATLPRGL